MLQYTKLIINSILDTFLSIKQTDEETFAISGKDIDGKYFWLSLSKNKLIQIRDFLNQTLELKDDSKM